MTTNDEAAPTHGPLCFCSTCLDTGVAQACPLCGDDGTDCPLCHTAETIFGGTE